MVVTDIASVTPHIRRQESVMTGGTSESQRTVRQARTEHAGELQANLDHAPVGWPMTRLADPPPAAVSPDDFAKELTDEVMGSPDANIGPFYERLIAEEVPLEGAREWVKQWYIDARMFPSVIAQITASAGYHYDARQFMGANLAEELGEFNPAREHPVTVRKLGLALGVAEEDMEFAEPYPETLLYVEYRQHLVRDFHWLEALAAGSFAIELTIPNRFRKVGAALKHQFGLDDDALVVFGIHAGDERLELNYGGDEKHAEEAANLIRKYAVTAEMQQRVRLAVWRSIQARRVYQWGLYREIVLKRHPAWGEVNARPAASK
jgi:pyrroloquinoline quinone (PQQ) biosynthesis protein C